LTALALHGIAELSALQTRAIEAALAGAGRG
jgi:hypothetical protein